jgi:hypothetical protein
MAPSYTVTPVPTGLEYTLPVRSGAGGRRPLGLTFAGVGLLLCVLPAVPVLLLAGMSGQFHWNALAFFSFCPGGLTIPVGLYLLTLGLTLLFGQVRLTLDAHALQAVSAWGPVRTWTRVRRADLRGLQVEDARMPNAALPLANLKAIRTDGAMRTLVSFHDPALLRALADELGPQLTTDATRPVLVEEVAADPTDIRERPTQPSVSTARVTPTDAGVRIDWPAKGLWRGLEPAPIVFAFVWNLLTTAWSVVFIWATLNGEMKWDKGPERVRLPFMLLVLSPFWLVGGGALAAWIHYGTRRLHLRADPDRLALHITSRLGTWKHEWAATDLESVCVVSRWRRRMDENRERLEWTTGLAITAADEQLFLTDHPKAELEWLATTIRRVLNVDGLPANAVRPANELPPPEPKDAIQMLTGAKRYSVRYWVAAGIIGAAVVSVGWEVRTGYPAHAAPVTIRSGPIWFWSAARRPTNYPKPGSLPVCACNAGIGLARSGCRPA